MLKLEQVSKTFYPNTGNEKRAMDHLDLLIHTGEFVTVIGSNGAGKSTLFNLIAGSILPDSGRILLDNEDITFLPEHKRASRIGRIFQDPMRGTAPSMTVEENLALSYLRGKKHRFGFGISKKEREFFREQLAQLELGLEDRMQTPIGMLSGGQRQRLTIARALVRDPEILIMDDSASALDFATDAALRHAIHEQTKGMTVFIVSQRATSIKQADKILVLDDGELAGVGTHKELMESCEVYREICLSQLSEQEVNR